jgi:hypothetical protein
LTPSGRQGGRATPVEKMGREAIQLEGGGGQQTPVEAGRGGRRHSSSRDKGREGGGGQPLWREGEGATPVERGATFVDSGVGLTHMGGGGTVNRAEGCKHAEASGKSSELLPLLESNRSMESNSY